MEHDEKASSSSREGPMVSDTYVREKKRMMSHPLAAIRIKKRKKKNLHVWQCVSRLYNLGLGRVSFLPFSFLFLFLSNFFFKYPNSIQVWVPKISYSKLYTLSKVQHGCRVFIINLFRQMFQVCNPHIIQESISLNV